MREFTREELYNQIWSKSAVKLAKEIGVSDVAISKACKRHSIPKPPLGYWSKLAHGKRVSQPQLPVVSDSSLQTIRFDPVAHTNSMEELSEETTRKVREEKATENKVVVRETLVDPHPMVVRTEKSLRSAAMDDVGLLRPKAKGCLDVVIGPASLDRALRLLDALVKALESRSLPISSKGPPDGDRSFQYLRPYESNLTTWVEVEREKIGFRLTESVGDQEIPLTAAQKKENAQYSHFSIHKTHQKRPRGILGITVRCEDDTYVTKRFSELDGRKLELRLNSIIAWMYTAAEQKKIRERKHKEWHLKWEEEQRLREEAEERRRRKKAKIAALKKEVAAWHRAEKVRRYVKAVEQAGIQKFGSIETDSKLARWIKWARSYADHLDPIRQSEDP